MRYVIIGNSYAAVGAVESIRQLDQDGEIIIISDEKYRAYGRPLITYWIAGDVSDEKMDYRTEAWYQRHRIQTKLGQVVTQIEPQNKVVVLANGEHVSYDKLLICTGGTPIVPRIPGFDAKGVFTMTRLDDAKAFKAWADDDRVKAGVIIGAGLIGLSVFKAMKGVNVKLTLVELLDRVLGLALDYESCAMIEKILTDAGVDVRTASGAEAIIKDDAGRVKAVRLRGGDEIPCEAVVMAVGVRPNTDLLKGSGIKVNRGIVVDDSMATSVEDVYASGDVVESLNVLSGQNQVIAILCLAYEQGRIAGWNMAEGEAIYPGGIPLNSLPVFNLSLMTMGVTLTDGVEGLEVLVHQEEGVYRKLVFEGDRLVGAILVGNVAHGGVLTWMIRNRLPVPYNRQAMLTGDPIELETARLLNASKKTQLWAVKPEPSLATR